MPSLLPFFFLSLLITNLGITANLSNKLSKPTAFLYNVNGVASFVQLMSFISGYPVGAKLIAELYKERITKLGKRYNEVQKVINQLYKIANEVIKGKWGNGLTRKQKLNKAGYPYKIIQKIVNEILGGK